MSKKISSNDKDDLEAFSYLPEADRLYLYQWLIELPFVRTSPLNGRHNYHDLVQALFSRHLYQRSRKEYYNARKALAHFYQQQMDKMQEEEHKPAYPLPRQGRPIYRSTEWLELAMAAVYQLFLLPDVTSHQEATELLLYAYEDSAQTGEMTRVLRKLIQEQLNNFLSSSVLQTVKLLLRYIEADPPVSMHWQELINAANDLLKRINRTSSFSLEILANIYRKRGYAYIKAREYQSAIADFDRAIELFPNYARAYASRATAYRYLGEYKRALEDYDRAIELKPNYVWAYTGRGYAYSLCKEYARAIEDLSYAIEIDPYYANAYLLRGYTYLWLKNSVRAIADFTRSWKLSSTGIKARWTIEWSHMNQERPDTEEIKLLEDIADPDPERYWSLACRGAALWLSQHFEDALALLERAISLEPYTPDCYFWRGMAYASLTEYTAAIGAIKKALELGLPPILLRPLHWFEQERPDFYQEHAAPLLTQHGLL